MINKANSVLVLFLEDKALRKVAKEKTFALMWMNLE